MLEVFTRSFQNGFCMPKQDCREVVNGPLDFVRFALQEIHHLEKPLKSSLKKWQ